MRTITDADRGQWHQAGHPAGRALAGPPETVREQLAAQIEISGLNFVLTRFAFGDLSFTHSLRSVELFAQDVMPWIRDRSLRAVCP